MKTAILFGSTHGTTRKVVKEIARHLSMPVDVFDVGKAENLSCLQPVNYELLLFLSPTYGDEELQDDMENFLLTFDLDLSGKFFAICELGSYYGYEDFSFGAMRLMREHLLKLNGQELCEPLSLDSFPRVHWRHLLDWVDYLKGKINERRFSYA